MKIRWIIEVRGVLQKNKKTEEVYYIGQFSSSDKEIVPVHDMVSREALYLGPFSSEEEACDIASSVPADQFNVAVHPFMETEQEMKQAIKVLTEEETGSLMQTFFMIRGKINAGD